LPRCPVFGPSRRLPHRRRGSRGHSLDQYGVRNIAGFAAGYITGALKELTGGYIVPMFLGGALMLLSAILMVVVSMKAKPLRNG
jgi:hypothetical protein